MTQVQDLRRGEGLLSAQLVGTEYNGGAGSHSYEQAGKSLPGPGERSERR